MCTGTQVPVYSTVQRYQKKDCTGWENVTSVRMQSDVNQGLKIFDVTYVVCDLIPKITVV